MSDWALRAISICERFNALIIPLWPNGLPATKVNPNKWQDLAPHQLPSNDPEIIHQWAERFKAYGVVPTENFLIIDVDIKDGQNGKASLKYLRDKGLSLDTFTVISPSGGLHLYYSHPTHYTPMQGAGHRVLFENEEDQVEWDKLQDGFESSGIDTRYGWGYVVGPESIVDKGVYRLIKNTELGHISSKMYIGRKRMVKASTKKVKTVNTPTLGFKISKNRNNDALAFTHDLRKKNLPEDQVRVLITEKIKDYDNSDGEAPTFDTLWDQYVRAGDKVSDIISELIFGKVFVVKGENVLDINSKSVTPFREFKTEMRSNMVPREVIKQNGDISIQRVNPADAWVEDPDRLTVKDIIYDPRKAEGVVTCTERDGYPEGPYFNTFTYPKIVELSDEDTSDMGWEIFQACNRVIENVLTDKEDRIWFKKWIGALLFNPGFRPAWHWHIFSKVRGIGKDTLANIVSTLYGESNCARYDSKIFTDDFNRDLFNYGLGILSDFTRISSSRAARANSNFKQITGSDSSRMRGMYQEGQQRPIHVRFLMISNDGSDFPVDFGDRRLYKAESKGIVLDSRTYTLANLFINPAKVTAEQLRHYKIDPVKDSDIQHAKALLYDSFRRSGYEDIYRQVNCPRNETKDQFMEIAQISYVTRIEEFIKHHIFVCASDLITEQTLQLLLQQIGVDTKVRTVISELKNSDLIKDVNRLTNGREVKARVEVPMLMYDKDLDMISPVGKEAKYPVYAIRNFSHWCDVNASRQMKKEIMKITGVRNIHTVGLKTILEPTNAKVIPMK